MNTNELPEEMMNQVEDAYTEIMKVSKIIKDATERRDKLRAGLKHTMDTVGLKQGQSLQSPRLGLYALVVQGRQSKLNRDALAQLGVSEAILALGTITKYIRPYVKLAHVPAMRSKGQNQSVH